MKENEREKRAESNDKSQNFLRAKFGGGSCSSRSADAFYGATWGYPREAAIRPNKDHRTGNDRIACSYSPENICQSQIPIGNDGPAAMGDRWIFGEGHEPLLILAV
jgi:hypothetical protein